jgi:hypothetical protein
LLSFSAESFVFQITIQKCKAEDIENYNFAGCFDGCGTWPLTLREERRLRAFENRVPTRISGAKRSEVTEKWRRLHTKEHYALHSSPNIRVIKSGRLKWAGRVARMGDGRGAYRIIVRKT